MDIQVRIRSAFDPIQEFQKLLMPKPWLALGDRGFLQEVLSG